MNKEEATVIIALIVTIGITIPASALIWWIGHLIEVNFYTKRGYTRMSLPAQGDAVWVRDANQPEGKD